MVRLKIWFVLLFFLISYSASATNYYVSNSAGNDSSDGKTQATAWKTISKVNSKTFVTGDSVFLMRGDLWRELLTVSTSGTAASYMYFGGYGTGNNPKMLGSSVSASWTDQGGNVWKSSSTFTNPANVGDFGTEIFFENNDGTVSWGVNSTTLSNIYNWYWSGSYIYIYSTQNPATAFKSVEIPQRASIINLNDKNYLHFNGIDLFYCGMSAITYKTYPMIKLTGLIVEYAKIAYVSTKNSEAGYGIDATYCDMIVRHCEIHDCGRRSISHHLYGNYTATNILIEDNYFHDGWHTTGPDFSVGASGTTGSIDGVIVRRNKFYDPPNSTAFSEHIFIQNYLYSSLQSQVKNLYIYSNIFISPSANAINMEGSQSVFIYNNVFYNHNVSGKSAHVWCDNNNAAIKVKNNIFYSTTTNDIGGTELFMRSGQSIANVDADFNLYYRVNNTVRIIDKEGTGSFNMTQIAQVRTQLGLEKNSPTPANPNFVSTSDFHVQSGSPAIGKGLAIDVVVTDFEGRPFNNPPNIGCYANPTTTTELTYISSSVENSAPSILNINFNLALASVLPVTSDFTVMVNSVARAVSLVGISGTKVLLSLSSPVVYGDKITVAYTKPVSNPLQSTTGKLAISFTAQTVTNNVLQIAPSVPVYTGAVIQNATPSVLEMNYSLALANILPAASSFTAIVNSASRSVVSLTISGTRVLLNLSSPVVYGDIVTISYTQPAANPLQIASGGKAASISVQPVTNNVGAPVPVYVSSVVEDADPGTLALTYDLTLAAILPGTSAFAVTVNSVSRGVSSVSVSGTRVLLTLSAPVAYGDLITVAYTQPVSSPLQTAAGAKAATMTARTVTNNLLPPVPVFAGSVIENITPDVLTITYDMTLANIIPGSAAFSVVVNSVTRGITTVIVSGTDVVLTLSSPVVFGDIVTVSYTQPSANQLQTPGGLLAETIAPQTVSNSVAEIPAYLSSSVENFAPSILIMNYNLSLANIQSVPESFAVTVNSVTRIVNSVSISGTSVLLTLSSPVAQGDIVTVSYTQPASNQIQTTDGGMAVSIGSQPVLNNVGVVIPVYVSSVIANSAPSALSMTYSLALDNTSVPDPSSFTVRVNSLLVVVSSVSVSGTRVTLNLSAPVISGNIVTVAYTQPASNPLQTALGGIAGNLSAQNVTNQVLAIPVYVSSVIENSAPSSLVMTYSLALSSRSRPAASSFSVMVNSIARTVTSVSLSGTKVTLRLSAAVFSGDIVTVSYTPPASNPLQTTSGVKAVSISEQPVTNNVIPLPVYTSSSIENTAPSILVMNYSLPLTNIISSISAFKVVVNSVSRTISSVSISGTKVLLNLLTPVEFGNTVTVSYTKPANNPLQTTAGGQAVTLAAQQVTNNVAALPVFVSAAVENANPSVLSMTYNLALANIVPANSSFSVIVNTVARNVSSISISGTKVLLTLSSPLVSGDVVTVAYTLPAANPIQTAAGGNAVTLSAQPVTNNVAAVPVYMSSLVENATPSLITLTYSLTLTSSVPGPTAFTVMVNSVSRTVTSVAVSGTKVLLTLASQVASGNTVTVAYAKPALNPLQTAAGGQAAALAAQPVTNNVSAVVPLYLSSVVENIAPSVLKMTYSTSLANIVPTTSAFRVTVNTVVRTVSSVSLSGTNVLLTLSTPVIYGNIVTVSYTIPASNQLQTPAGVVAASIVAQPVTNNVIAIVPVYLSSVIENASPANLALTYNNTLAGIAPGPAAFAVTVNAQARTVSSVAVSGFRVILTLATPVVYGDIVMVSYTKPAVNPLQTTSGGQAINLSPQPVTNNVRPLIPGYVSSVIENAEPAVLLMTYNLSLANVIPASSAFTVTVNSVPINVVTVVIAGGKVRLTLESAIVNGDIVTVAYTKPSANPLQSSSTGQAVSLSAQIVVNNVGKVNSPPVVVIYNEESVYSGFISGLDASGTYDQNNDNLTFNWVVPSTIPVSSATSSKIRFLAPKVTASEIVQFTLNVSDGKATQSKTVDIEIQPYEPQLSAIPVLRMESDGYLGNDNPGNVLDGDQATWWSSHGDNHWIVTALGKPSLITYIQLTFPVSPLTSYYFDIYASTDDVNWEPILINAASCSFSGDPQVFEFPVSARQTNYSYVKLLVHGGSTDDMNYISEFRTFGVPQITAIVTSVEMTIFPNPANDYFRILLSEEPPVPYLIKIISMNGTEIYQKTLDTAETYVNLPVSIRSGAYIVQLSYGNMILAVSRLVIHELRSR